MRAPLSWLREYADIPADATGEAVAEALVRAGLEVEEVVTVGADIHGPLVIGKVLAIEELTEFKKPIRFCRVEVGPQHGAIVDAQQTTVRGVICGASNFVVGDVVVVAPPGTVLPGGFEIASRETYGRLSDGMICSERELGLGQDHDGILVVVPDGRGNLTPGQDAGPILGLGDTIFDIAVTPDRGYCLSIRGLAREAATGFGVAFRDPGTDLSDLPAPAVSTQEPVNCRVEDFDGCDLFMLRTLVGFNPSAPSPYAMRRRLAMCGMRSVSLAVDITNYVMLELGQPLHAFDVNKLQGGIVVRRATLDEKLETLDHVVRDLDATDILITDDRGAISLAGTMGGTQTEIDDASTDLVIEAAHFSSSATALMSRRHKLSSEASRRFERGVDRMLPPYASARAIALLIENGGGMYIGATAVEAPHSPTAITIDPNLPGRVASLDISIDEVVAKLEAVGCEVTASGTELTVAPPTWRPDLTDPADLVEEVVRLIGYDNIPSRLPHAVVGRGLTRSQRLRRQVGRTLAGAGYTEVLSYPFVGAADLDALALPAEDPRRHMLELANPISTEQPGMRTTLVPGLLAVVRRNVGRGIDDVAIYEIGSVFHLRDGHLPQGVTDPPRPGVDRRPAADHIGELEALLPDQPMYLAVTLTGDREPAGWWGSARESLWADAIEAARLVADSVHADLTVRVGASPMPLHPGRCAELVVDGEVVGYAGELHPRVVQAMGLPPRTSVMELNLDLVLAASTEVVPGPRIDTYPVAKEDVALIVDEAIPAAAVEAALRAGAGELLESVRLFDVYTGAQVGEGKRSLAYALRFRAPDRTLSIDEVTTAREAAVASAAEQVGAVLRGA